MKNVTKEEQKQHLIDMMKDDENLKLYKNWVEDAEKESSLSDLNSKANIFWSGFRVGVKSKQEITPEEVFKEERRKGLKEFIYKKIKENTMKNILGTTENLELFNKEGVIVYDFYKNSNGSWHERTYDSNGYTLTRKDSSGYWTERTRDSNGKELTFKDSNGYWSERTYDSNGNELTYKDYKGVTRGFDIPEYTMEQLIEKLGNFKIKK